MSETKDFSLNTITSQDTFRVVVFNKLLRQHFEFTAHGDMGPNRPAQFTAHIYDSASLRFTGYIDVETISTDSHGARRSVGTGRTLDELVHNLDWPHRPSELAALRLALSSRQLTNCKDLIGDLVLRKTDQATVLERAERAATRAAEELQQEQSRLQDRAKVAIDQAVEQVTQAAKFGLRMKLAPDLTQVV